MVTSVVTIPTFSAVSLHVLRTGILPAPRAIRRGADALMSWIPLLAVGSSSR